MALDEVGSAYVRIDDPGLMRKSFLMGNVLCGPTSVAWERSAWR